MSKREEEHQPEAEENVEDMDVPEGESEEVKGGLSLNFSKVEFKNVKLSPNTNLKLDTNQLGDGSV